MEDRILTALVLILANQLREQARGRGVQSTSDYTREAAQLITDKQSGILGLLGKQQF